jgi:hypothetical protein
MQEDNHFQSCIIIVWHVHLCTLSDSTKQKNNHCKKLIFSPKCDLPLTHPHRSHSETVGHLDTKFQNQFLPSAIASVVVSLLYSLCVPKSSPRDGAHFLFA